jgi:hypothetical protein
VRIGFLRIASVVGLDPERPEPTVTATARTVLTGSTRKRSLSAAVVRGSQGRHGRFE